MNSIWIARDSNGLLYAYKDKPIRNETGWRSIEGSRHIDSWYQLNANWFLDLRWEDEPIELIIKVKED